VNDTVREMKARLASLNPQHLEIVDESALHAGHAGAKSGGGHFQLTLVSAAFTGQSGVARHRLVYRALGDLMGGRIHALSITALSPEEL
jgi:BolA family transcriptional regulator, general stress-responsive regulator